MDLVPIKSSTNARCMQLGINRYEMHLLQTPKPSLPYSGRDRPRIHNAMFTTVYEPECYPLGTMVCINMAQRFMSSAGFEVQWPSMLSKPPHDISGYVANATAARLHERPCHSCRLHVCPALHVRGGAICTIDKCMAKVRWCLWWTQVVYQIPCTLRPLYLLLHLTLLDLESDMERDQS